MLPLTTAFLPCYGLNLQSYLSYCVIPVLVFLANVFHKSEANSYAVNDVQCNSHCIIVV